MVFAHRKQGAGTLPWMAAFSGPSRNPSPGQRRYCPFLRKVLKLDAALIDLLLCYPHGTRRQQVDGKAQLGEYLIAQFHAKETAQVVRIFGSWTGH